MSRAWVDQFIGLNYANHGRDPDSGLDCWGLVLHVFKELIDFPLPDFNYGNSVRNPEVASAFDLGTHDTQTFERVEAPQAFDIVVFNIAGRPAHCGVMVSATHFLHIHAGTGSCIDGIQSPRWGARLEGFYRPRPGD